MPCQTCVFKVCSLNILFVRVKLNQFKIASPRRSHILKFWVILTVRIRFGISYKSEAVGSNI